MRATVTRERPLLEQLDAYLEPAGAPDVQSRLRWMTEWLAQDMASLEEALADVGRGVACPVERSARHLLARGGKRLRPLCVTLAARAGRGGSAAVLELAVAVELVHNATLLHDDVVDLGELRRGVPAARVLYGNAASIFAGDWLLVEAIRRIERARVPGTLDRMLAVIDEMIHAEARQLVGKERRTAAEYLAIVEGKTAALFRWALYAGARAGGLGPREADALDTFGRELGIAFQLVDDVLDFVGDAAELGKAPLGDLREGKLTYPLILALEREPALRAAVDRIAALDGTAPLPADAAAEVAAALGRTRAIEDARALAAAHADAAADALAALPPGQARAALEGIARASIDRRS